MWITILVMAVAVSLEPFRIGMTVLMLSRPRPRVGRTVLIRTDAGGGTHEFLDHLTARRLAYSVGFGLSETMVARPAPDPRGSVDPGLRQRRRRA